MNKDVKLSVVICTWNRSSFLSACLDRFANIAVPEGVNWELVLVNNGSTDDTDAVASSFLDILPLRLVHEPAPGLSNARNRAIQEVRGEYILWTDDDVLVPNDWLTAYHQAFERWPEASFMGGPIIPLFEGESPSWLPEALARVPAAFAAQDMGKHPVPVIPEVLPSGPYGANMAMRTSDQRRFLYDPRYGVQQTHYSSGEETDVMRRMLESGLKGWWAPKPAVHHRIPEERQTLDYLRRWLVGCGIWEGKQMQAGRLVIFRRPAGLWAGWLWKEFLFRIRRLWNRSGRWMSDFVAAGIRRGHLDGYASRETSRTAG